MVAVFSFIQKRWDELKEQVVSRGAVSKGALPAALKQRKWIPADDKGRFPGFVPPENRFFLPEEVYLKSVGHLVAGEAPLLLGGTPSNVILNALGMHSEPAAACARSQAFRPPDCARSRAQLGGSQTERTQNHFRRDLSVSRSIGRTSILWVRKEGISSELDDRGIMIWDLPERRRPDWSIGPDDSMEPADQGTDPYALYDEVESRFERDTPDTAPPGAPGATLAPDPSESRSGDEVGIPDEDKAAASPSGSAATAVTSQVGCHPGVATQASGRGTRHRGSSGAAPTTPRAGESSDRAATNSIDHETTRAPTSGDSKTGPDGTSPPRGPRGRYVTYVVPDDAADPSLEDEPPEGSSEHKRNMEISRAAVARVLEFERSQGRVPKKMPHLNPGYDVESLGPTGEVIYIEVKGIDGPWDAAGVRLSAIQFRFTEKKAESGWLYVVEWARDNDRAKIHRIQNPANKVTVFCFDQGWGAVAGQDQASRSGPPAVE
jgi:uncharacterized protein DUF3883